MNKNRLPFSSLALLCLIGGCTCTPDNSVSLHDSAHDTADRSTEAPGAAGTDLINQTNASAVSGDGDSKPGAVVDDPTGAASQTDARGVTGAGSLPLPSHYPQPIVGQAIRLDKPVQEPRPGYLIIPDDKPADEFMSGLPPTGEWKSFVMAGTSLSDNGLVFFPRFPAIHTLDASDTRVSDEGCRHLEKAKALQTLALRNTRITDAGLEYLQQLKSLRYLDLTGTQVTEQGVVRLQQALPALQVKR